MKHFAILTIALLFFIHTQAQEKQTHSISGTVVSCQTGKPCNRIRIDLVFPDSSRAFYSPSPGQKTYYIAYSDSLGHFNFPSVEDGEYLIGLSPRLQRISLTTDMVIDTLYFIEKYYPSITQDYLTDSMFAPLTITSHNIAVFAKLAKACKEHIHYNYREDCFSKKELSAVMATLPLLKIPDTMEVDLYCYGGSEGWTTHPYVRNKDAQNEVEISFNFDSSDSLSHEEYQNLYNQALEKYNDFRSNYKYSPNDKLLGTIPRPLQYTSFKYIEVPFTEEGIWQAYLFYMMEKFLPRFWHALYGNATLIVDREALKFIYPQEGPCSRKEEYPDFTQHIMDSVSAINNKVEILSADKALITTTWWYDHSGLIETHHYAFRNGKHIRFEDTDDNKILFKWGLPIMY